MDRLGRPAPLSVGLEVQENEKKRFLDLADRLARSADGKEQQRLKEELAFLTFGE